MRRLGCLGGVDRTGEERAIDGRSDLRPLGAELFVAEDRSVAEGFEDCAERWAVFELGLGFDADLVTGGVAAIGEASGWRLWVTVQRLP